MRRYLLSFILCFILVFSVFTLFFQGMEVKAQPAGPAGGGGGPPTGPPAGEEEGEVITSEHVSTKVFLIPSSFSVGLGETITVSCWVEDSKGNRLTNGAVAIFATGVLYLKQFLIWLIFLTAYLHLSGLLQLVMANILLPHIFQVLEVETQIMSLQQAQLQLRFPLTL